MKSIIQLKTATPPLLITLVIACFALSPGAKAVGPEAPDAALPNGNTAEGDGALSGLTGGFYNSAFGFLSLLSLTDGNFCTGVGAGTLLLNNGGENTATGAGALLSNNNGENNTAIGAFALFSNVDGFDNTAVGDRALFSNTTLGIDNTAIGHIALQSNTTGGGNTAVGNNTLVNTISGNLNTALGANAGNGVTTASHVIAIGSVTGTSSVAGEVDDSCYIDNIFGGGVDPVTALLVFVDADGKLGTTSLSSQQPLPQLGLNEFLKEHGIVQEQGTMIAELKKEIASLTTTVKEQAARIEKVSAKLEMSRPGPRMVATDR